MKTVLLVLGSLVVLLVLGQTGTHEVSTAEPLTQKAPEKVVEKKEEASLSETAYFHLTLASSNLPEMYTSASSIGGDKLFLEMVATLTEDALKKDSSPYKMAIMAGVKSIAINMTKHTGKSMKKLIDESFEEVVKPVIDMM